MFVILFICRSEMGGLMSNSGVVHTQVCLNTENNYIKYTVLCQVDTVRDLDYRISVYNCTWCVYIVTNRMLFMTTPEQNRTLFTLRP